MLKARTALRPGTAAGAPPLEENGTGEGGRTARSRGRSAAPSPHKPPAAPPLFLCLLGAADALRMGSASQTGRSREGRPRHPAGEAAARPGAAGGWVAAGLRRVPRPGVLSSAATLCGVLPYLNMHPFFPANWSLSSNSCVLSRLIPLGHMLFFLTH